MNKTSKSESYNWLKSIIISIIVASVIRWGTIENFKIPSSSMEGTLLTGDIVAVSKLHYGPRLPMTPLQVPLTHQKIWGTNIKSYLEFFKLPYFRFPGFSKLKRGDKIVFNNPIELWYPIDLKTYYTKRLIGLPGDELKIVDSIVYINNQIYEAAETAFHKYYIITSKTLNNKFFEEHKINNFYAINNGYVIFATSKAVLKLKSYEFIEDIEKQIMTKEESMPGYYGYPTKQWNTDNFGPIIIPKEGMKIKINKENLSIYSEPIKFYEGNKLVRIEDDKLWINNEQIDSYTFKQNYYFVMGDNRHYSKDSRFSGFIPEDHILGKIVLVLFSINNYKKGNLFKRIRWDRIFRSYN